ncbi:MAG: hypothetical protein KAI80_10555, partial [Hyphomicrobiaceae bacterium]|nr:hypothetical protein [Hyphomicrobiaceae bacterium]
IAELSITDPPGSDPLSQGDDQIRTCKRSVFNSFAFVDKAVTITADQMNQMAIKNEVNEFTAQQNFLNNIAINVNGVSVGAVTYNRDGFTEWAIRNNADSAFAINRTDVSEAFTDTPLKIDNVTGVVDFAHVPTVQGAPLWIAGELRQFVASSTPGTNWFVTDGTNGTVDLRERILMTKGATHTTPATQLDPNLIGTAAAGVSGATALTEAQLPAHNHTVYITNNASGGITDININTTDNVFGGRRNDSSKQFSKSNGTRDLVGNAGSGGTHTHTTPATALSPTGVGANVVRPKSTVVETWQYVP